MPPQNPSTLRYEGQVIEKPTAVWVFGVLNIAFGCYHLFRLFLSSYKTIIEMQKHPENTKTVIIYFLISVSISAFFWIWLIIAGVGLLKMKRWSRRLSIIYSLIQIVIFSAIGIYTAVIVFTGLINPPQGKWPFLLIYVRLVLTGLIYPILLLIFMKTEKVKRAFAAIGG